MFFNRRILGRQGEELARKFFRKQGFTIVDHNFRSRFGEVDLILSKDKAFRFVEVKFRRSNDYGLPQEAVIKDKQEKIRKVALYWLQMRQLPLETEVHFDILGITKKKGKGFDYNYLEDAF